MKNLKVLVLGVECAPFYKVGGLADVIGSLPLAIRALGHDVRVALPRYKSIDGARFNLKQTGSVFTTYAGNEERRTEMLRSDATGVPTYFVWDERYFNRHVIYGQPDEAMAFVFFVRAVFDFLRSQEWIPDIIHANDWHTTLAPIWLNTIGRDDPLFASMASMLTIHNLAYQGLSGDALWGFAGLADHHQHVIGEQPGTVNWMARGIAHADMVNAVSVRYAHEMMKPEFGAGLDRLLIERKDRVAGILNGIDLKMWNPGSDATLSVRYNRDSLDRRVRNKHALQRMLNLSRSDEPLIGMVTRLFEQKGLDILIDAADDLFSRRLQLVLLGTGDESYENAMRSLAERYPDKLGLALRFDEDLARLIYGGSDMFLMPSRYEPSGLGQMIAMRYGSIPVVRATGGLADSVVDIAHSRATGTGFKFGPYTAHALLGAIDRALKEYHSRRNWRALQERAMKVDFSWTRSAEKYVKLYRKAIRFHKLG